MLDEREWFWLVELATSQHRSEQRRSVFVVADVGGIEYGVRWSAFLYVLGVSFSHRPASSKYNLVGRSHSFQLFRRIAWVAARGRLPCHAILKRKRVGRVVVPSVQRV